MVADTSSVSSYSADNPRRVSRLSLPVDVDRTIRVVAIVAAIVLALGIARQVAVFFSRADTDFFGWDLINLDGEANLPAWFSGILLFAGGIATLLVARVARGTEPRNIVPWTVLAIAFVILSADEIIQLHELTKGPLRAWREWTGVLMFPWVIWAIPLVLVAGAAFIPFLMRVNRATARRLVIAGSIYVFGAIVMEMVAGPVIEWRSRGNVYALCFMLEESGEIVGAVLYLRAVLLHLAGSVGSLSVDLKAGSARG